VVAHFVDICRIVDDHCLNFLFILKDRFTGEEDTEYYGSRFTGEEDTDN